VPAPGTLARSWKAQRRQHARYLHLLHAGKAGPEATVAVALAGFAWAEMTAWAADDLTEPVGCRDARRGRNDPREISGR
jgi:hypothetical protein